MDAQLLWKALVIGLAGGVLGGMLGVGGGIIMVPLLMALLGLSIHDAKADSLAIIVMVSLAGTIKHVRIGKLDQSDWVIIAIAGITAIIGSNLGVIWAEHVPKEKLLRIFAVILIISGIKYLLPAKPTAETPVPAAAGEAEPESH